MGLCRPGDGFEKAVSPIDPGQVDHLDPATLRLFWSRRQSRLATPAIGSLCLDGTWHSPVTSVMIGFSEPRHACVLSRAGIDACPGSGAAPGQQAGPGQRRPARADTVAYKAASVGPGEEKRGLLRSWS